MRTGTGPIGVLLYNLGGPKDLDEVEPFLVRLFSDREIIQLPFGAPVQLLLARLIAKARGPSVRRNYARIGGGSPQLRITRAQAAALEARLNHAAGRPSATDAYVFGEASATRSPVPSQAEGPARRAVDEEADASCERCFQVFVAMRYSRPSTGDALTAMAAAGVHRVVSLTLFPHWSKATTGSWQNVFRAALAAPRWARYGFEVSSIDRYPDDSVYLDALADTVGRALAEFPAESRDRAVILFSAHGLPKKFVDAGDPYVDEIERTRRGVLERLKVANRDVLGYQSRTGPVKWIGPGTDELIRELGADGVKELLVVPLSFVSDHIETLYEVDILFADVARRAGIVQYRRADALNTHPQFIDALARLVERHLEDGGQTRRT
jgi:ferrochelatase